ncbi:hypothetical protein D3C87_1861040 [compost metagenome]
MHLGAFVLAVIRQLVHSEDRAVVVLRDFDRVAQMIRVPVSQQDGVDFDVFRVRSGSGIARQEGIDDDARLRRFHQQRRMAVVCQFHALALLCIWASTFLT